MTVRRRMLVVEDEPLFASLLAEVLRSAGFEVRTAGDAATARSLVTSFDPDVALLDITLGRGPSGLDLAHVLHAERPDVALVFLTRQPDGRSAGLTPHDVPPGAGFLRKDRVTDTGYLLAAVEEVLADRGGRVRQDRAGSPLSALTAAQLAVVRLAAQGWGNEAIAQRRGTSVRAVQQMVHVIAGRLGVAEEAGLDVRTEVVRRYIAAAGLPERG